MDGQTEHEISSQELREVVTSAKDTSQLYDRIIRFQNIEHPRWAIVGPHFLPNEATSLALSYALGPNGLLYSIDPQGGGDERQSRFASNNAYIVGGSIFLEKQLLEFKAHGIPLSQFKWLGGGSHFGNIPAEAQEIDGIVDHSGIEFLEAVTSNDYLINGVRAQISALKSRGIYVYQSEDPNKLIKIFGMPYEQWLTEENLIVVTHTLSEDTVEIKMTEEALVWLGQHKQEANGHGNEASQLGRFVRGDELIFEPSEEAIWYPSKYVFVGQKQAVKHSL